MERLLRYTCPCCGYRTLYEPAIGTFDICELCGWEDDMVQNSDPDYEGGANGICLREAQHDFLNETIDTQEFIKDSAWKILEPLSKESRSKNCETNFTVSSNGEVKNT